MIRKIILIFVAAMLAPIGASATAYTASTASGTPGNWNSAATWGGVGVPGSGDTVTIPTGKGVLCNDTEAVGTSVASSNDFVVTGTGQFTMNSGCVLSVKGDAMWDSGASFTCAASSGNATWQFVVPGGDAYFFAWSGTGTGPFTFNFQGTSASNQCIFTTTTGGGTGTITNGGHLVNTTFTLAWAQFSNLGSSSVTLDFSDSNATVGYSLNHVLFDNDGQLVMNLGTKTLGFTMNAIDFRRCADSVAGKCWQVSGTGVAAAARLITNVTMENLLLTSVRNFNLLARDVQIGQSTAYGDAVNTPGMLSYNSQLNATTTTLNEICRMCAFVFDYGSNGMNAIEPLGNGNAKLQDFVILEETQNQHQIVTTGNAAVSPNAYSGFLCDGNGFEWTDTGNCVMDNNPYTLSDSLCINFGGEWTSSGGTSSSGTALNNSSFFCNPFEVDESATVFTGVRNNLLSFPGNGAPIGVINSDQSGFTNVGPVFARLTSLSLDYNFFNMMAASGDSVSIDGTTVNATGCTGNGTCLLPNPSLGNTPSYVMVPTITAPLQASAATTAGSTTATSVTCSTCSFVSNGVQAGDYVCDETATPRICAPIANLTITATTLSLVSPGLNSLNGTGHNITARPGYQSTAGEYYGTTAGYGTHDQHTNPQFIDPNRNMCTWYVAVSGAQSECVGFLSNQIPATSGANWAATASTDTTHIFCSTCSFTSWGLGTYTVVQVYSGATTTVRGRALVSAVTSATELTLATAITGTTSGDRFVFVTATQGIGYGLMATNGWDYGSGSGGAPVAVAPVTWSSPVAALSYIRRGYKPMNGQLKNAAKPSDCTIGNAATCDIGSVPVFPSTAQRIM